MQNLVIVESPTKARTLAKFLGKDYQIQASMGHIRDLPKSDLGVDTENNFEPKYIIPRDKKKRVNELKKMIKEAKNIWLASDPDREGEAIAWHIASLIGDGKWEMGNRKEGSGKKSGKNDQRSTINDQQVKRVEFHEITEKAIKEAFNHPRELDMQLVDAQQARRVLDRLVGYKLSPLLWKKVKRGMSAGRVQTVALKLIVEREREVLAFKATEYWSIEVTLKTEKSHSGAEHSGAIESRRNSVPIRDSIATLRNDNETFTVSLLEFNGKRLLVEDPDKKGFTIGSEKEALEHVTRLENADYQVAQVTKKEVRRQSAPPFTTSTLQQTAGNRLGFTAKKTMMVAQNLYEHGLITYMRTDSVNLSTDALEGARDYIGSKLGQDYLPPSAKVYKSKSKNAQEAHEAIRPTNISLLPEQINADGFTKDHKRLYDLIWKRMVASQVADAILDQTTIDVKASTMGNVIPAKAGIQKTEEAWIPDQVRDDNGGRGQYLLRASGSVIKFDGWLRIYNVSALKTEDEGDEKDEEVESKEQILPELSEGDDLEKLEVLPKQHFTLPPPRYNEASLIKKMEELGIGRPSTYAPTLSTIQDRFYVEKIERKFIPTVLGFAATDFLVKYFPDIFDYAFTASMEDKLDDISRGERQWRQTIGEFYKPFSEKLESTEQKAERVDLPVEKVDKPCPDCGKDLIVRTGKFGKFLACSGFPDCKHTEPFEEILDVKCPTDGGDVVVRKTKTGKTFYGCKNYPKCTYASWTKPKS